MCPSGWYVVVQDVGANHSRPSTIRKPKGTVAPPAEIEKNVARPVEAEDSLLN